MTTEQWKRAGEITTELKELYEHRKQLQNIEAGTEILQLFIEGSFYERGEHAGYRLRDAGQVKRQPEWVKTIHKAFVMTLRAAYDKEIKKLEQEFEAL